MGYPEGVSGSGVLHLAKQISTLCAMFAGRCLRNCSMLLPSMVLGNPNVALTTSAFKPKKFCATCEVPGSSLLSAATKVAGSHWLLIW